MGLKLYAVDEINWEPEMFQILEFVAVEWKYDMEVLFNLSMIVFKLIECDIYKIRFNQLRWLKSYIDLNTELRKNEDTLWKGPFQANE